MSDIIIKNGLKGLVLLLVLTVTPFFILEVINFHWLMEGLLYTLFIGYAFIVIIFIPLKVVPRFEGYSSDIYKEDIEMGLTSLFSLISFLLVTVVAYKIMG